MLRHASLMLVLATTAAMTPTQPASAQQHCSYTVTLFEVPIASSLSAPPAGYTYAPQPSRGRPAGSRIPFAGQLTATKGCVVQGQRVQLQSRTASEQNFVVRRSPLTDQSGNFRFTAMPSRTSRVRASYTPPSGSAVTSPILPTGMRVSVGATYLRTGTCSLSAHGSTFPAKPRHPVYVQERSGEGYVTVAGTTTDERGRYRVNWAAGCGPHDLVVTAPQSATNTAGRTLYERQDVLAR